MNKWIIGVVELRPTAQRYDCDLISSPNQISCDQRYIGSWPSYVWGEDARHYENGQVFVPGRMSAQLVE